jgi:hypothetical protein
MSGTSVAPTSQVRAFTLQLLLSRTVDLNLWAADSRATAMLFQGVHEFI